MHAFQYGISCITLMHERSRIRKIPKKPFHVRISDSLPSLRRRQKKISLILLGSSSSHSQASA